MKKAVFLDKDGVITVDNGDEKNYRSIEFYPGMADLIALFHKRDYLVFVATNQPVVSRGTMTEKEVVAYLENMRSLLKKMNNDAVFDKIYYCPHHPNADVKEYRVNCDCRKPKPGMLLQAAKEFNVDLKNSFMVGDRISDVIAGSLAGCKTIQALTGMHDKGLIETDLKVPENIKPDHIVYNVIELKDIIL
jgi:D-glycero-D-manno-heptose 1,7-bisphosphate phosphatase